MTSDRYVPTQAIREAVKGRETEVLAGAGDRVAGRRAAHLLPLSRSRGSRTPPGAGTSGRPERSAPASRSVAGTRSSTSSCASRASTSRRPSCASPRSSAAHDLIEDQGERISAMDAASLLRPPADQRDDDLARSYLAHRLGVPPDQVPMPSTPVVGWRELPYYDPPAKKGGKPKLVGRHPCVVFGTVAPDGRQARASHLCRRRQAPAKPSSASAPTDVRATRRSRPGWRPGRAPPAAPCSGAIRQRRRTCCSRRGSRRRLPSRWRTGPRSRPASSRSPRPCRPAASGPSCPGRRPGRSRSRPTATRTSREDDRGFKAGEKAARAFALAHHERLEVRIALPGDPGEDVDWLDVLRRAGVEAVRTGIAARSAVRAASRGSRADRDAERSCRTREDDIEAALREIVDRAQGRSERSVRARGAGRDRRGHARTTRRPTSAPSAS